MYQEKERTMELNKDIKQRDEILFGAYYIEDYRFGGCKRFDDVSVETLEKLVELNFLDQEDAQNSAPTAKSFIEFMKKHPGFEAHGYAVTDSRPDYRVTIEGLNYLGRAERETIMAFAMFANGADDFTVSDDQLYCWWD